MIQEHIKEKELSYRMAIVGKKECEDFGVEDIRFEAGFLNPASKAHMREMAPVEFMNGTHALLHLRDHGKSARRASSQAKSLNQLLS